MFQNATSAKSAMNTFLTNQNIAQTIFYEPLYSQVNLAGFASATDGGRINTQEITFFSAGVGQTGQGWQQTYGGTSQQARPLTQAQTNLKDSGKIPAGSEFIADSLGVDVFTTCPQNITDWLTSETSIYQERLSMTWDCGATRYWPCAEYGTQSKAASTTESATTITYPTNGGTVARRLPADGGLFFPAKQQIIFKMRLHTQHYITTTGQSTSVSGVSISENAVVGIVMTGWRFNVVSA
jgi:hypothetical protein